MSNKKNFTFLWGCGKDYIDYMCLDVKNRKNVTCKNKYLKYTWNEQESRCKSFLKIRFLGEVFFELWLLKELNIKSYKKNYIVFSEDYLKFVDFEKLKSIKKFADIFTVLYINDPIEKRMNIKKNQLDIYREKLDLVITTDSRDAKKYNLSFFPLIYSKVPRIEQTTICYDLSFIGRGKGREEILNKIEKIAKDNGLDIYMKYKEKKITGNDWMEYSEILNVVRKSNCILEVVQTKQTGITLRTLEAICYGKKLLTNNTSIKKYPFYDSRYIQIFRNVDEISLDFISERREIKYNYENQYSPINLLKYIVKQNQRDT